MKKNLSHEEQLKISEAKLKALINNRNEAIWSIDTNYNYIAFNERFKQLYLDTFGIEISENDNAIEILPEGLREFWKKKYDEAFEGKGISFEYTTEVKKDEFTFQVSLNPILIEGNVEGISVLAVDVTKHIETEMALKKSEEKFRSLIQFAPSAFFHFSSDGTIIDINNASAELTGYSQDELLRMNIRSLFTKETLEKQPLRYDLLNKGETVKIEREVMRKDGTIVPAETISKKMPDGTYQSFFNDISKRVEALTSLREREENYRLLTELSPDPIVVHCEGKLIFVNKAAIKMIGAKSQDEMIGKPVLSFLHPDSFKVAKERIEYMLSTGKSPGTTLQKIYRFDGTVIEAEVTATPLLFNGKVSIMVILRDVTEIKGAMKALKESEDRFRTLTENTSTAIVVYSGNKYVYVNKAAQELTGYRSEELLNMNFWEIVHPDYREIVKKRGWARQQGNSLPSRYEIKLLTKRGEVVWVDYTAGQITWKEQPAAIGSAIDITEKKIAEEKLRASERKLRSIFNAIPDLFLILDSEGRYLEIAPSQEHLLYLPKEKLLGKRLHDIFEKEMADKFLELIRSTLKTKKKNTMDYRLLIDGKPTWFQVSTVPYEDDKVVYIANEITDRKMMEERIRKSENQFRSIWENSIDAMRLLNEEGIIVDVNSAFCELVGKSRKELIGQPIGVIYKASVEDPLTKYRKRFRSGKIKETFETEVELWSGKKIWVELSNTLLHFGDSHSFLLSIFRDVTEKKNLLNHLIEAKEEAEEMNRLKSQFFVYMSHELRTPFMGIMGYAQILRDSVEGELREMAEGILRASKRLLVTLSNILDVTKLEFDKTELITTEIDIKRTINQVYSDFENSVKLKNLEFKKNIDLEDVIIKTDERIILGILNNLINNAIKYTDEGYIQIYAAKKVDGNKEKLILKIEDTGIGIPKEKHDIIWKEFRQVSEGSARAYQGSGLGLTIVKKYVEMVKGKITLDSEVGKGSTFTVEIPLN